MTEVSAARSARTAGDSWGITESVGATALGTAAARAAETAQPDPLIRDDFAYLLVAAAGPVWAQMASTDPIYLADGDEYGRRMHRLSRDYQAVRTHYFDEYFNAAAHAGIRQIVLLAAGLDSRAYRLTWPAGTVVYELDQPKVLEYKGNTLDAHGAVPTATRRAVPVDLREDWPAALRQAGFDPQQPTAWLAEGLLCYLPAAAQDLLLERITALSAPGSRLAVEAFNYETNPADARRRERWQEGSAQLREHGIDIDFDALAYHDPDRADVPDWLSGRGWSVSAIRGIEQMARMGRPVPADLVDDAVPSTLVRAYLEEPAV
ncbi:class I SAM-dependent methyltransferase [uncultured Mycolicibacterium sp.]|uniref:class I SAM-dependent methyltransferase n=1 Tax=uncultured Mycolicibacterium sp. TaxID=2320817 RepID=UPI00261B76ED|nr:class I SAM-dependent methyltransferase [uncultured Mycolicibacterium sp.]